MNLFEKEWSAKIFLEQNICIIWVIIAFGSRLDTSAQ